MVSVLACFLFLICYLLWFSLLVFSNFTFCLSYRKKIFAQFLRELLIFLVCLELFFASVLHSLTVMFVNLSRDGSTVIKTPLLTCCGAFRLASFLDEYTCKCEQCCEFLSASYRELLQGFTVCLSVCLAQKLLHIPARKLASLDF